MIPYFSKDNIYKVLDNLNRNLGKQKAFLTVFDSAVCVFLEHPSRLTVNMDVWKPLSKIENQAAFKEACYKSQIGFNTEDKSIASIQLLNPGIADIGFVKEEDCIEVHKTENLLVRIVPPQNIIAFKLIRASERDIEECVFLIRKFRVSPKGVKKAINTLKKKTNNEMAMDNFGFLEVSQAFDNTPHYKIRERVKNKLLNNKTAEGFRDRYVAVVSFLLSGRSPSELLLKKD